MPLEIVTVPCLSDNYAYLLRDAASGRVGLVDAPEAGPIEAALAGARLGARPHPDHPPPRRPYPGGGRAARLGRRWWARRRTARRLPRLDVAVRAGRHGGAGRRAWREVIDVPGHTVGHVAYYFGEAGALFSADSLMVMGCGRLFEGTPEQMWASLSRDGGAAGRDAGLFRARVRGEQRALRAVGRRGECGAEDAGGGDRGDAAEGRPTVPARLDLERATNPFLRARDADFKAAAGAGEFAGCPSFRRDPPAQGRFLSRREAGRRTARDRSLQFFCAFARRVA